MNTNALRKVMSQFIYINDDEWAALEPHLVYKRLKKRDIYVDEGEICNEIGFVLRGAFRQFHLVDGEEKSTYFYFDNQFVTNYQSFVSQQPSIMIIEALEDVEMLSFDRKTLEHICRLYSVFETFGRLVAEYVVLCTHKRLNTFLLQNPEERYIEFLKDPDSHLILERIPQHYIASFLGITPVSLSRIRNRVSRTPHKV